MRNRRDVRRGGLAAAGALAFVIFVTALYPAPAPILFLGAVLGSLNALIAMGLVLIYRTNRIINFAQGELGAIAGLLGALLIAGDHLPYYPAMLVGLGAALVLGGLVEIVFVRRFARAPRLILIVVTIGIAQVVAGGELFLPQLFGADVAPQDFPAPFKLTFTWGPVVFQGAHFLAIGVVIAAGLGLVAFFRRTHVGIAVRGMAESSERAAQLGIPVRRLGTIVWMLAAGLSALASLLKAPIVGIPIGQVLGPALLLRAMAAAVIGRMEDLRVTFAAAVVLGMVEQAVVWHTGRTVVADAVLFFVIIGALLMQRGVVSHAQDAAVSTWELVRKVRPIPAELRHLAEVRYGLPALQLALVAVLLLAPNVMGISRVNLLATGLILAIVGVSLVILTGWAGEISLGQMALFGFGAATAARLAELGWNFFVVLVVAGLVGAAVSMIVGLPALRIRGPFLAVATFAFALATSSFFLNREFFGWFVVDERIDRPTVLAKFSLESEHALFYVLAAVLALVLASARSIGRTRTGRAFVMVRDNPRGAQALGINLVRVRLLAFAMSGFLAALAGAAFAFHQHGLSRSFFVPEQSIRIFSMVVFGGLGSLSGVLAGAAYFTGLDYFVGSGQYRFLLSGAGLLLVLLLVPGGLGQVVYALRDGVLRRIARARGVVVPSLVADPRLPDETAPQQRERPPRDGPPALVECRDLDVSYDHTQVLFGVDFSVAEGEVVALLGTNGAGKSTLLKAIAGSVTPRGGRIVFDGADITTTPAERTVTRGVVLAPGGKGAFPSLTVEENLELAAWTRADAGDASAARDRAMELFPVLRDRLAQPAGSLSGGEQQMLTLAQAFLAKPRLLMIDELSLGLAPLVVTQLLDAVKQVSAAGTTVVIVEQSVNVALTFAERAVFMEKGEIRFDGPTADLLDRPDVLRAVFLGPSGLPARSKPKRRRPARSGRPAAATNALTAETISVAFGGIKAVNGVDLVVPEHSIVGVIGPNGAGKTTLFDVISGFAAPDAGRVLVGDDDVTSWGPDARARRGLGRSFQDARLFPSMTVREAIAGACERHVAVRDPIAAALLSPAVRDSERKVAARVDELLELLRISQFADKFVAELSTGSRRIVDLACCLAHEPAVLLLDEPSSGIAQRETEALAPMLLDIRTHTGAVLLVIEHDLPLITAISDQLVALDLGRVVAAGPSADVLRDPAVVASYLGSEAREPAAVR